jgi:hypothetical protein
MNYTPNMNTFRLRQETWMRAAPKSWVIPGLGVYQHDSDATSLAQLDLADAWGRGFAVFSSNCLLDDQPRSRQRLAAMLPRLLEIQRRTIRR